MPSSPSFRYRWCLRFAEIQRIFGAGTCALAGAAVGCSAAEEPPGRSLGATIADASSSVELKLPETAPSASAEVNEPSSEPGHGAKIASIAMRTWIYVAPDDRSTKLGYLRAGAVVDRAEASAGTTSCAGGWYRVKPRGFVCVGKGASLSLDHQVVEAAIRGPNRAGPTPYAYVFSDAPPPHLYFRLPTKEEQDRAEGMDTSLHARLREHTLEAIPKDEVPKFLAEGRVLPKPYGAEERLHYVAHAGRANENAAFGLITSFEWTGRRFGLTTELDLIPLDRTKPARISKLAGIAVPPRPPDPTDPAALKSFAPELAYVPAMVPREGAAKYVRDASGQLRDDGVAARRSGWVLTGRHNGTKLGMLETTAGAWLAAETLLFIERHDDPVGHAAAGKKWIEVSIKKQLLVAWEGRNAAFATLVSTGRGGMADWETTTATIRGIHYIRSKHVSGTMDGNEGQDSFELHDVPFIQYFHEGYALHGAYWHDEFGKARSHGCVNLSPADAAWIFEWTDPPVPAEWHGAVNNEGGTLVWTHG